MIPFLFRQPSQPQVMSESDTWFVTSGTEATYNVIVEEIDNWRERAMMKKTQSGGLASISRLFSRKQPEFFVVDQSVPPRLYRVKDNEVGEISFELTEVEGSGTSIKSTYNAKARTLIQNLKAKMPAKVPGAGPKVCPSCGKEMLPEFKVCPYCGSKIK